YTRTGVGTLLNAGTVAGIMCRLMAGPGLLPKWIPSFAWLVGGSINEGLGLSHALDAARADMTRRGVELGEAMVKLLKGVEQSTRADRSERARRSRRTRPGCAGGKMTEKSEVLERVREAVSDVLGVSVGEVAQDSRLVEDLGAESIQIMELIAALADEFEVELDEQAALQVHSVEMAVDLVAEALEQQADR
ncbi:MAG: acyl carrier protein, partial [Candidatus Brocadiaceae bacterium]